jgi:long-chain acyl-CoA synthetase
VSSLAEILPGHARARPDRAALIAGDRVITYGALEERVRRTAGALAAAGVGAGDRVAVLLGNVPEFVEVAHAAWRIGAAVAPLNVMLTPEEIGYVVADADAGVVVSGRSLVPSVLAVRDRLSGLEQVLVTGRGPSPRRTASYERALSRAPDPPEARVGPDDLALLAYTSGTTAEPKGAMLTHGNLVSNLDMIRSVPALMVHESDVVLAALPLFHIFGLSTLGLVLREGGTAVLVERFDPTATLDLAARHQVTVLPGAPPMFQAWLTARGTPDLSSIRLAVSGAAPLPEPVLEAFRDRFGIPIWEGYGLTEAAPVVTTTALGDEARPGSIGLPLPGVEIRLVDERGAPVEEGDPGEIVVRGANVFAGYWRRPEETKAAFRDGWLLTGDVAYRDDDGYLHIVDRTKDVIIVSGFNVFPKEVEDAIALHPDVAECAVLGVPDDRTGEAIRALVVPRPGGALTEEDVIDLCRDSLARFKWPRDVVIVDSLPRHVTGKVLRRALRQDG